MAWGMARGTNKWEQSNARTPQVMKSISNKERGKILERLSNLKEPSHIVTCFKIEAACIRYNVTNTIRLSNECKTK
jgi:hypothetical protein